MNPPDMQSELNTRILSLVDWVGSVGKELEAGAREQVPLLAKEILHWGVVEHLIYWAGFLSVSLIMFWIFRGMGTYVRTLRAMAIKWNEWCRLPFSEQDKVPQPPNPTAALFDAQDIMGLRWVPFGIGCIVLIVSTVVNFQIILKIWVAPRVYLVETASEWLHR